MMDTKEALKELEDLTVDYGNRNEEQIVRLDEAIDMAIGALRAQADGDTISRKATIDAMEGVDWYHIDSDGQLTHGANSEEHEPLYKAKDVYAVLNQIPSAQPELPEWAQKVEEYRKSAPKTFSSPIAWALYQTWREYAERRTDDR